MPKAAPAALLDRLSARLARALGVGAYERLCALADQGASGVANILVFMALAAHLSVARFADVGMMVGVYYFLYGFHRSAVVLPFTADHGEMAGRDRAWFWLSALFAGASVALVWLLACALALIGPAALQWMVRPMLLAGVMSPAMLTWEFVRRWLYKMQRADLCALGALVYGVGLCGAGWALGRSGAQWAFEPLVWIIASALPCALCLPLIWPPERGAILPILAQHGRTSLWLAAGNIPHTVYGSATIVVLIGAISGPMATAIFTAARTLTNPAMSIVSAIDSIDKPRAARALAMDGPRALLHTIARTRLAIILSTGLFLGTVALFAGPVADLAFHGRYAGITTEIRLLALVFFLFGLHLPTETLLITLRMAPQMLVIRAGIAVLTVACLLLGAPYGVRGMAVALCVSQSLGLAALLALEVSVRRKAP